MTPAILFLLLSFLFVVPGLMNYSSSGNVFLVTAGFLALFSGIYWLFQKGKRPLSPRLGYFHAIFTAVGMFLLSRITMAIILVLQHGNADPASFIYDSAVLTGLSVGVILFLCGQIVFIVAVIRALGGARQQKLN